MGQWDEEHPGESGQRQKGNGHLTAEVDAQAQIQEAIENARAELDHYVSTAADFIRQRPVACVAGAVAIGFIVGKIASRR
jgi:ElaB/YqjD/DUF883 family membrane-anchored ribosome-binding protein